MKNFPGLVVGGVASLTLIGSAGVAITSASAQGYSYRDAQSRYYDYCETRRERMIDRNNARRQRMIERNNYRRQEQSIRITPLVRT